MKVLEPGHLFELDRLDVPVGGPRTCFLEFVRRVGEKYPGNPEPAHAGTTSQEVLRALIQRALYVNNQQACPETSEAVGYLIKALWLLECRAARLHGRKNPPPEAAVYGTTCPGCGHVGCAGGCGRV